MLFLASHKDITSSKQFTGLNSLPLPGGGAGFGGGVGGCGENDSSDEEGHEPNGILDPEAPANYNYGRRRSRAVLYQLSGHYKTDKSKKIHSKLSTNVRIKLGLI